MWSFEPLMTKYNTVGLSTTIKQIKSVFHEIYLLIRKKDIKGNNCKWIQDLTPIQSSTSIEIFEVYLFIKTSNDGIQLMKIKKHFKFNS